MDEQRERATAGRCPRVPMRAPPSPDGATARKDASAGPARSVERRLPTLVADFRFQSTSRLSLIGQVIL